jgi:signal transduction histidine kinase
MNVHLKSLRQKVITGYVLGFILTLGVIGVNWRNLSNVESMVISGEMVSDLFDTTLEIRRFEKNYLLYAKDEDYMDLLKYLDKAETLLSDSHEEFVRFSEPQITSGLMKNIKGYRGLLKILPSLDKNRPVTEQKLNILGKAIVTSSEKISKTERRIMQATLQSTRKVLTLSIIFLVSAGFIGGAFHYPMFIKPLKTLEKYMKRIARGEYSLIPTKFEDSELISLTQAFNKMLLELQRRQTHIVQAEKLASLGKLVFGVAHELNNPLSNISTSCQILKEELEDADINHKRNLLHQIEEETERARDVVGSLLDFSKTKETTVPEELILFADKQKIQQVLLNLIKNAIDAIPDEGKIIITASKSDSSKEIVEIKVKDTGTGMQPNVIPHIFDPFYSSKSGIKGYGLGLFIAHTIIKEHGGTIKVEKSHLNKGTTFSIKLPAKEH